MYQSSTTESLYGQIVDDIITMYDNEINRAEASEAAQNLIGFVRILLEVHDQLGENIPQWLTYTT